MYILIFISMSTSMPMPMLMSMSTSTSTRMAICCKKSFYELVFIRWAYINLVF